MKKIMSVILILCMLASSCAILTACDAVSEKKVEKDPVTSVATALENSLSAFFTDEIGAEKVLEKAQKKGSYSLTFACEDLFEEILGNNDLSEIREVIYADAKDDTYVSDTFVTYGGKEYNATVWADKTGIALKSEAILGNDDTLRLVYETFLEKFEDSDLYEYILEKSGVSEDDIDDDAAEEIKNTISGMIESIQGLLDEKKAPMTEKEQETFVKEVCRILNQSITTVEMAGSNGKESEHIAVEYVLDNEAFADLCDFIVETSEEFELMTEDEIDDMKASVDDAIDMLNETYAMEIVATFYINAKENTMTSVTVDGEMLAQDSTDTDDEWDFYVAQDIEFDVELSFGKSEILLDGSVEYGGTEYSIELTVAKETADGVTTYDLDAKVDYGNLSFKLLDAEYTYNKETGDITLEGKVSLGEASSMEFVLEANCVATKNELTFKLEGLEVESGNEILFKMSRGDELTLVIKAEDIMDMKTEDWEKLEEDFKNSELGKLLFPPLSGTYIRADGGASLTFAANNQVSYTAEVFGVEVLTAEGTYAIEGDTIQFTFDKSDDANGMLDQFDEPLTYENLGGALMINGTGYYEDYEN